MVSAAIWVGIVGAEREQRSKPAGFRTINSLVFFEDVPIDEEASIQISPIQYRH